VAPVGADRVRAFEVREADDVDELGASRRRQGLEAVVERCLHLLEGHGGTLVPGADLPARAGSRAVRTQ